MADQSLTGLDPETPLTVLNRFGIRTLEENLTDCTVTAAMPVAGMRNPFTGEPSLATLAVLVDDAAGRANYYRRPAGQWTVSSELTLEMSPGAMESLLADPDEPVIAAARPLGPSGVPMLAICTLTHRGAVIGGGTVHTVPLEAGPDGPLRRGADPVIRSATTTLAQLMAVEPMETRDGGYRLHQQPDPMINNLIGIVHGGVSSAGLELVASAAINHGQDQPFQTTSLRVNFLRPFFASDEAGAQSLYEGTALRIGRMSAVGDARAVGRDGKAAVIARLTGYR